MPQLAANLSMMFNEVPFLDRFERAAKAGFTAVEYLFPYEYPAPEIAARLKANGLRQVLFNAPPGNWAAGERGLAAEAASWLAAARALPLPRSALPAALPAALAARDLRRSRASAGPRGLADRLSVLLAAWRGHI